MNKRVIVFFAILALGLLIRPVLNAQEIVSDKDIAAARTLSELKPLADQLNAGSIESIKANGFNFKQQEAVLKKTGEIVDKLVWLHGRSPEGAQDKERAILLANREIVKRILDLNKKVMDDLQDKLDTMENPLEFFKTPAWQQPEQLLTAANFRLGWNNYYAGLLIAENDPLRKQLLTEAVESFSHSFLNSKDDKLVITSLFGRGLCSKQLKVYKDALKDFKAVKEALKKDDPMYLRCRYEEIQIASQMGNHQEVLRSIDDVEKAYPANRIPEALKSSLKDLKESSLHAIAEKTAIKTETPSAPAPTGEK